MNNGYDPSPVGAVGLEPSKSDTSTGNDLASALRDVPVLIQLPDLGGSFETPEPSFSIASDVGAESFSDETEFDEDATDPVSDGESNWKEPDAAPSSWLSRSLTIAFLLGIVCASYWLYSGSGGAPPAAPGLDQWTDGPVVEMPGIEGEMGNGDLANDVDQDPGNSIHTDNNQPGLELNPADGSLSNNSEQPPLPDFTPNAPALADKNDGVGPRTDGYPFTDPATYRYDEEMPFMRFGLRVEPLVPNQERTIQQ